VGGVSNRPVPTQFIRSDFLSGGGVLSSGNEGSIAR
jgi:hypothetical protein